jgi:hypothetical protein
VHDVQAAAYGKIVKKTGTEQTVFDLFGNSPEKFHKKTMHFLLKITDFRVIIRQRDFFQATFYKHFAQMGERDPLHGLDRPEYSAGIQAEWRMHHAEQDFSKCDYSDERLRGQDGRRRR